MLGSGREKSSIVGDVSSKHENCQDAKEFFIGLEVLNLAPMSSLKTSQTIETSQTTMTKPSTHLSRRVRDLQLDSYSNGLFCELHPVPSQRAQDHLPYSKCS